MIRSVNGDKVTIEYPNGKRSYISLKRTIGVDDAVVLDAPRSGSNQDTRKITDGHLSSLKRNRLLVAGDIKDLFLVARGVRESLRIYTSDRNKLAEIVSKSRKHKNPLVKMRHSALVAVTVPVVDIPLHSYMGEELSSPPAQPGLGEIELPPPDSVAPSHYGEEIEIGRTFPLNPEADGIEPDFQSESDTLNLPPPPPQYPTVSSDEPENSCLDLPSEMPDYNIQGVDMEVEASSEEDISPSDYMRGQAQVERLFPVLASYWDAGGDYVGDYELDYDNENYVFSCRHREDNGFYLSAVTGENWQYLEGWLSDEAVEDLEETCLQLLREIENELDNEEDEMEL